MNETLRRVTTWLINPIFVLLCSKTEADTCAIRGTKRKCGYEEPYVDMHYRQVPQGKRRPTTSELVRRFAMRQNCACAKPQFFLGFGMVVTHH